MKALITLLILGASSAALAQPAYGPYSHERRYEQPAPVQTYDWRTEARFDNRFDQRARFNRPMLLAQSVRLEGMWNHPAQGPKLIQFDGRVRGMKTMRIDSTGGPMYLDTVVIHFADGRIQTVRPHVHLSNRNPSAFIDLDPGQISSMYVYATPMRRFAAIDVIGLRR